MDIDIGGPFATKWTQVAPGGFFRAPTWWSRPGQKKLSNMALGVHSLFRKCQYLRWMVHRIGGLAAAGLKQGLELQ